VKKPISTGYGLDLLPGSHFRTQYYTDTVRDLYAFSEFFSLYSITIALTVGTCWLFQLDRYWAWGLSVPFHMVSTYIVVSVQEKLKQFLR
jgi:hypothetical protein